MNKVILIGNICKDPELSETNSGVAVCRFSIAVNRRRTSAEAEQQTDFFNVTVWRGLAETVARYCKKGNKVAVSGQIQIRQYEDREGAKRTSVDVVAEEVEFLSPKSNDEARTAEEPKKKPALEAMDESWDCPF